MKLIYMDKTILFISQKAPEVFEILRKLELIEVKQKETSYFKTII